jgi:hypothetical protein
VSRSIRELKPKTETAPLDLSGMILHECPCGANLWRLLVTFDDYEIATYFTEMECAVCGTYATAPTPVDRPEWNPYD